MFLRLTNGHTMEFHEHPSGLYLHDAGNASQHSTAVTATTCAQTVAENKSTYTRRQLEAADDARRLHRLMGRPSPTRFHAMLANNSILDCPITVDDARRADAIYGPDVAYLKGKTVSQPASPHLATSPLVPLPTTLASEHPTVVLCGDIMFFLGCTFHMTVSRDIRYTSLRPLPNRLKSTLLRSVGADLALYSARGFTVTHFHGDGEYKVLESSFPAVDFAICAADDHVPEAERGIRTIKETMRATIHGLPYKRLPTTMVHGLAVFTQTALNATPHPDGASQELSPHTIVTGHGKPNYRNMKLEYGEYVQVYDGTTNNSKARTAGAIALYPSESEDGGYHFMSLATGKKIKRRSWTKVPISDLAISRVEAIAANENMPLISEENCLDEHDPNSTVDEDTYDQNYQPKHTDERASDHEMTTDAYTDESDDDDDTEGEDDDDDDRGHDPLYDDEPAGEEERETDHTQSTTDAPTVREEEREAPIVETVEEEEREQSENGPAGTTPGTPIETTDMFGEQEREHDDPKPQTDKVPPKRSGLRPNRGRDYSHRYAHLFAQTAASAPEAPSVTKEIRNAVHQLVFTQMSAEAGIKKHGQVAEEALMKEFQQFRDMDVFEPMDAATLTDENKKDALKAISVIKEKRCGKIKGRTVADGRKQRDKYTKAETTSPTVSTDALFLTMVVDAHENRDVATADVSGAYLNAEMDDLVIIRLTGKTVDLMCRVNPEWEKYVIYEGKTKVLYLRCNRALYGCVKSRILWYELFTSVLVSMGFKLNPYDPCIANATIDGKQCTICWYVDDTKISHVNAHVVTKILEKIEKRFNKLTITRGLKHEFLGMNIHFPGDGTVRILMDRYLREAITDSGLRIASECSTPAATTLTNIDPDEIALSKKHADTFHSIVAKLIYVGTQARGDILPTLAFLCSRVSCPTENDERKLKRLLGYLKDTVNEELILSADSLNTFSTWVDASFAPHTDKRSHTGGVISFG